MDISKLQLTDNFKLNEFAVSSRFPHLAEKVTFDALDIYKALIISSTILQPIRDYFNSPVKITSGKCTDELNEALGRKNNTDHSWDGARCATDIVVPNIDPERIYLWVMSNLPFAFGQLICYLGKHNHISLPSHTHHGEYWIKQ